MKKVIRAEVNNFTKGLITEASPLNYPPNAVTFEQNYEFNRDGTVDRRLGLDYEPSFTRRSTTLSTLDLEESRVKAYPWVGVSGVVEQDFLVVQLEQTLQFYDINVNSISADGYKGSVTLSSFPVNTPYSFSSIEGVLVAVAGVGSLAIVSFDGVAFAVEYDTLKVRDVWGVEVTDVPAYEQDAAYRGALSAINFYNLQNQSWGIPRKNSVGTLVDPIPTYFVDLGYYPSNSETVWTGLQFQPVTGGVTFERLYTNLFTELKGANVKATKGYYIIDFLSRGVSRQAAFAYNFSLYPDLSVPTIVLPADTTANGASIVADYAGRTWYAGFGGDVTGGDARSPNISNFVLFSQLVKSKTDITKCYQEGDPSSRESADLVDTDGGFVRLSGAKDILGMVNLDSSLMVIASNGVWQISGGNDYGFTATTYKITKLSSFGGIGADTIVIEGGRAFFWSADGIFVIAKDNLGVFGVTNITEKTIQTLYEAIPNPAKEACVGVYDSNAKKIRWFFNNGVVFTDTSEQRELVLDVTLSAFYTSVIQNTVGRSVEVKGAFTSRPFRRGQTDSVVYSSTDAVLSSTDDVVVSEAVRSTGLQSLRYITLEKIGTAVYLTFSYYHNSDFKDWYSIDSVGVDAKGILLTGNEIAGDSAVAKQIPYLVMHFKRTENGVDADLVPINQSSCFVRCQWAFSNTAASNKWSELRQAYRYRRPHLVEDAADTYDTGFELITTKNKLRGRGRAFALYIETEAGKDCRIVGWNVSMNGNQSA
jgi:hypothetical protein